MLKIFEEIEEGMSKLNHRGIHVCESNCWSICIEDFYKECMLEMNWWKDKIV